MTTRLSPLDSGDDIPDGRSRPSRRACHMSNCAGTTGPSMRSRKIGETAPPREDQEPGYRPLETEETTTGE